MWLLYIPGRVENVEMCLHTWKRSTVSVVINLEEKKWGYIPGRAWNFSPILGRGGREVHTVFGRGLSEAILGRGGSEATYLIEEEVRLHTVPGRAGNEVHPGRG
jgi:hypothetical protein